MFNLKVVLISMMLVIGVSCSHGTHNHDDHGSTSELTLNDGKKWTSDKHTMDSINNMKKIAFNTKNAGNSSLKKALGVELESLIHGCTMEGEHHDALHVYLEELMPLIDKLANKDMAVVSESEKKIKDLLTKYSDYFELN